MIGDKKGAGDFNVGNHANISSGDTVERKPLTLDGVKKLVATYLNATQADVNLQDAFKGGARKSRPSCWPGGRDRSSVEPVIFQFLDATEWARKDAQNLSAEDRAELVAFIRGYPDVSEEVREKFVKAIESPSV
ncbi:MAG: hypothetical protein A2538_01950 [Candidatus Magasanikbacteria bacterium RIFOXYD2_FULL_41_14]|uniref:Uncharacterized protein n=1 Tax=Candidatus Magasanikbacteria bacterium RIFOXYD2_FULL_41_14 TaxID=1798709 RepID=A0A1F6PCI7_9BACT|nr:MAG: hypothetical protein A2538_01950 [Candidatus Magasanikbacteria bacterium RIFOXYD2_FULL_41_14]